MLPFYIFAIVTSFLPPWTRPVPEHGEPELPPGEPEPSALPASARHGLQASGWEQEVAE
jgi:hypothetical protein